MHLDYNRNIYVSEYENHRLSPKYDDFIVVAGSDREGEELMSYISSKRNISQSNK
jgi:hypothetical protein